MSGAHLTTSDEQASQTPSKSETAIKLYAQLRPLVTSQFS